MRNSLIFLFLLTGLTAHAATALVGLWEFENSSNLAQATVGSALTLNGTSSFTTGVTGADGAIAVPRGLSDWISVSNPIGANGATGTPTRTNQYSILLDFKIPDFKDGGSDAGQFTGIFDFDNGGTDGDFFIRKQANAAELGVSTQWAYVGPGSTVSGDGTAGTVLAGTWYRMVLTADVGVGRSVYLNGNLVGNYSAGTQDFLRQSLGTDFRVLWDNTLAEKSATQLSNIALYDGRLTATEVTALGGAGSVIAIPEPSRFLLVALGGLFIMGRRRRTR